MKIEGYVARLTHEERVQCLFHPFGGWMGETQRYANEAMEAGCFWMVADAGETEGGEKFGPMRKELFSMSVDLEGSTVCVVVGRNSHDDFGFDNHQDSLTIRWRNAPECKRMLRFVPEPLRDEVLDRARTLLQSRAASAIADAKNGVP